MTTTPPDPAAPNPSEVLLAAAREVHTPESFARAILSHALQESAQLESGGSISGTISVKATPTSAAESGGTELFAVCVGVGDHLTCVHVHVPISIHIG